MLRLLLSLLDAWEKILDPIPGEVWMLLWAAAPAFAALPLRRHL